MGIKSTRHLTRAQALELYYDLHTRMYGARQMTDKELGNALDVLREEECRRYGQPCFDNYLVVPDGEEDK